MILEQISRLSQEGQHSLRRIIGNIDSCVSGKAARLKAFYNAISY